MVKKINFDDLLEKVEKTECLIKWDTPKTIVCSIDVIEQIDTSFGKAWQSKVQLLDLEKKTSKPMQFIMPKSLKTQFDKLEVSKDSVVLIKYMGKQLSQEGNEFHSFYVELL